MNSQDEIVVGFSIVTTLFKYPDAVRIHRISNFKRALHLGVVFQTNKNKYYSVQKYPGGKNIIQACRNLDEALNSIYICAGGRDKAECKFLNPLSKPRFEVKLSDVVKYSRSYSQNYDVIDDNCQQFAEALLKELFGHIYSDKIYRMLDF